MRRCQACGTEVPADFSYCGRCGAELAPLPPEAEGDRRTVTVLFADVSGFTRLGRELDPEDLKSLLRRLLKEHKEIRVVILTVNEEADMVYDAIRAGALGYLLKTSTPAEVVDAIRLAFKGEAKITPKIATKVLEDFRRVRDDEETDDTELYVLSDREQEILDLVAQGLRNKEIASKLCIAEKTVKNHVSNILKALQVNSRTEAAMKAVKSRHSRGHMRQRQRKSHRSGRPSWDRRPIFPTRRSLAFGSARISICPRSSHTSMRRPCSKTNGS